MRPMAKETIVQVVDDIDGSKNAEEVSFAYQGVEYTIDLSKKNRAALERALKPYIEAGTKKSRRNPRATTKRSPSGRRDLAAVRAWANDNGIAVAHRGRIPQSVLDQYDAKS